jgi:ABC-type multidrug transport system fused ATPase/permease subunit
MSFSSGALRRRRRDKDLGQPRKRAFHFLRDFPTVLHYVKPHKRLAVASFGMIGFGTLVALMTPWPLAIVLDTVLGNKPVPTILGPVLDGLSKYQLLAVAVVGTLLITALESGLGVYDNYINTKLESKMILDMRSDLFRHAQKLSLAFHDKTRTGQLMFQLTNGADAVGHIAVQVPPLIQAAGTIIGMFIITYLIDPTLALVALSVVPFIYFSTGYYTKRIEPRLYEVRGLEAGTLMMVHEAVSMLRVIVSFGREPFEYQRFRTQGESAVNARVKLTVRQTMFSLGVNSLTATGTALVLGIGAYNVTQGKLTSGELIVVLGYIAQIYNPLQQISTAISSLQQSFVSLRNAIDLLSTDPEVFDSPNATPIEHVLGRVTYENVEFAYAGREHTLEGINFDIEPGSRVAVIGPTGAGKTTLVSLLMRFYDPAEGRILLDGRDIKDITLQSLRDQISIVLQEPLLFTGSIKDNIAYGKLGASEEEIVAAAEAANAHDFISRLPAGYETTVGERGARFSGGERQRICAARAFLKDAPILILDEPTSSVDSKTEAVILDALERLMEGRTTFLIAHRLSTVRHADVLLVLDHGELVEKGTHKRLLERHGLYRQLWEAQAAKPRRAVAPVAPVPVEAASGA